MNWELLVPLLITTVVAVVGWFSGHSLSASRDRANKHRDIRLEYLIEAYRRLENAGGRDLPSSPEQSRDLESAIADIQLFGSLAQITKL
jgi:hypothetical protein